MNIEELKHYKCPHLVLELENVSETNPRLLEGEEINIRKLNVTFSEDLLKKGIVKAPYYISDQLKQEKHYLGFPAYNLFVLPILEHKFGHIFELKIMTGARGYRNAEKTSLAMSIFETQVYYFEYDFKLNQWTYPTDQSFFKQQENIWYRHFDMLDEKTFYFDDLILEMEAKKQVSDEKLKEAAYDYLQCLLTFNMVEDKHAERIKAQIEEPNFRSLLLERGFWIIDNQLYPTLREIYMSYQRTDYFANRITEHLTKEEVLRVAKEKKLSYISMDEEYFYKFRRSF